MCDASGCVVIEAGASEPTSELPNPLLKVKNEKVLALLPTIEQLRAEGQGVGMRYDRGIFVRPMDYKYPDALLNFNDALFAHANVAVNNSAWTNATGFTFETFAEEEKENLRLLNYYFTPQRETLDDMIVISNSAVLPFSRIFQMGEFATFMTVPVNDAIQWRYERLNELVQANWGSIDVARAKDIINFLTPEPTARYNAPGFYPPTGPGGITAIEGSVHVADIANGVFHTLNGYYSDGWTQITLSNYM